MNWRGGSRAAPSTDPESRPLDGGSGHRVAVQLWFRDIASPGERLWASLFSLRTQRLLNAAFGLWGDSLDGLPGNPVVNR